MFCPFINEECRTDCEFYNDKCNFHYYLKQIANNTGTDQTYSSSIDTSLSDINDNIEKLLRKF